ncbi:MAG: protein kinase domain-containing protein [Sporichthyaceae bacterium]
MSRPLGDSYRVGAPIGAGSLGEVFYGEDDLGDIYAIKVLHPHIAADPAMVARFVYERNRLLSVAGPNIVGVQDLLVEGETLAIVSSLVPGGDLRAALAAGPLPPADVARIGAGVARGLEALHAAGVVHGSLKPEDVLLDNRDNPPRPRITDFGIAHPGVGSPTGPPAPLPYLAPERWRGAAPTPAGDLYALGVVLYELCCGVTPYVGEAAALAQGHLGGAPGRPAGVPDSLWAAILELIAADPARRPATAAAVAGRLDGLALLTAGLPAAAALSVPPPAGGSAPAYDPPAADDSPPAYDSSPTEDTLVVPVAPPAPFPPAAAFPPPAAFPPAAAASPAAEPAAAAGVAPVAYPAAYPHRPDGRRAVVAAVAALLLLAGVGAVWAVNRGSGDATSDVVSPPPPIPAVLAPATETPTPTPTPTDTATATPSATASATPNCLPFVPGPNGGLVGTIRRSEAFDRCRVDVRMIQSALKVETVDGYFGSRTEAAIRAFQFSKCERYPRFGVIDEWTWNRLIRGMRPRCPYGESPSPSPSPTFTFTPAPTATSTPSPTSPATPSSSPTATFTGTPSPTPTSTS